MESKISFYDSDIQHTLARDQRAAAGTATRPTDPTLRAFVGRNETGEATIGDFRTVGGEWLVSMVRETGAKFDVVV